MALVRMTSEEVQSQGRVDLAKLDATTEHDIRRHMIEDGEDPDAPLPAHYRVVTPPAAIRAKTGMDQAELARALRVPLETWQAWEAAGGGFEPVVQSFLDLVADDPHRAFAALADRVPTDRDMDEAVQSHLDAAFGA